MKKTVTIVFVCGVFLASSAVADPHDNAIGSSFGCLSTARAAGMGKADFGAGLGFADGTSFFGSFTYGLSQYTEGRFKLGLIDDDDYDDAEVTLGADFKYQVWSYEKDGARPLDMAVGGFFEYVDLGRLSVLQIGIHMIGSCPYAMTNGTTLSPYGRLNVRIESVSWDDALPGRDDSKTHLRLGLNAGVCWEVTSTVDLFGEFQIDGNTGLFLGIDYNVM